MTAPPALVDHPTGDPRFALIDRAMKRCGYEPDALIEVLHTAQDAFGYLPEDLLVYVASRLHVPLSRVYGVATFYHLFSFRPLGEHTCTVCLGTACYVKRSAEILAALRGELRVEPGHTTEDGRLSLTVARCLGSCGLAPIVVLDGEVIGRMTPETALARVRACLAEPAGPGRVETSVAVREAERLAQA